MANRYWVGGAGTWNFSSTTNWSDTSGGSGGFSVPSSADNVFFDQAGTYTVTMTGTLFCQDITVSAGTVTFAQGTSPALSIYGSMSLLPGTVWNAFMGITFSSPITGRTIATNGVTLTNVTIVFNGVGGGWTLGSDFTTTNTLTLTAGTLNTSTSNYTLSAVSISASGSNARGLILNSSIVNTGSFTALTTTNFTFSAGSSLLNLTANTSALSVAATGLTFNNVSFTTTGAGTRSITGANTFNTLSFAARLASGITVVTFGANQTISTLTLNAGTTPSARTFLASDTLGTQRTLAVTTLTAGAADYDFRDIAVTGSASPIAPTRSGDCNGNSGITFPAAKTVYYRITTSANWGAGGSGSWSLTSGGALDATAFPLAQDTAVFPAATYPPSGSTTTINAGYNIGTINMSLRTTNTMTLATGIQTPAIYGNWINGTGITLSGTAQIQFSGRGSQTITSAGRTFTQSLGVTSPGGSVTLQDAFITSSTTQSGLGSGTFNANGYNFTAIGYSSNNTGVRTIAIDSGTWTLTGIGNAWNTPTITNLTVTGTGTISLTNASAKTFAGGGIQTYPTLNQGGTGALTVTDSNRFAAITATTAGTVRLTSGTTNQVPLINTTGTQTVTVSPTSTTATIRGSVRSSRAALTGPLVLGAS